MIDPIEQAIQAKANQAPRITPADIQAAIASEHYFTAGDGVFGCEVAACGTPVTNETSLNLLTFCVLILKNGFTVTGESACASPENFNAEIGRTIARRNAEAKIWPLLGYGLRTKLANTPVDFRDRVRQEKAELDERLLKLTTFIGESRFSLLDTAEQNRLRDQANTMQDYSDALQARIDAFKEGP